MELTERDPNFGISALLAALIWPDQCTTQEKRIGNGWELRMNEGEKDVLCYLRFLCCSSPLLI